MLNLRHLPRDAVRSLRHIIRASSIRRAPVTKGKPHTLPSQLVVSLTSYPPRYPTLDLTLRSLLAQDMAPDVLVLWIAHQDIGSLPKRVLDLRQHGLLIRECEDLRSFKKIIPALTAYPDAFIVIADDDINYGPDWLRRFVEAYRTPREILCQRGKRFNKAVSADEWEEVKENGSTAGPEILPVGCGGVMYPPGSLPPRTTNVSAFMRLCPTADDFWLYWMFSSSGLVARRIPPAYRKSWAGSQKVGLWKTDNIGGIADRQVAALMAAYGPPFTPPAS